MTNQQLNGYLDLIARLIEETAKNKDDAAEIVRSAKVPERGKKEKPTATPSK